MRHQALTALVLCVSASAWSHEIRGTIVNLDFGNQRVGAELQLPLPELKSALGITTAEYDASGFEAYLRQHFGARAKNGAPFELTVERIGVERIDDAEVVLAKVTLTPPAGDSARWLELHSDLVVHRVTSHDTYVFVRRDLQSGQVAQAPVLLDMMHFQKTILRIDRTEGTTWRAFTAVFSLGMHHIAEGADHLMFLLVLLLPAPLLAGRGRWQQSRGVKATVRELLKIVTAFTLGHSVTLLVGAMGAPLLAPRVVESLIAVSILISAVHAFRPLFPGREAWVAGGFGLVHGMAFASVLTGLAVDRQTLVIGVLGFNLGIEAMQLAVVAVVLPTLVLLSHRPTYWGLRWVGAGFAAVASTLWLGDRALALKTPLTSWVDGFTEHGVWVLVALTAVCAADVVYRVVTERSGEYDGTQS